MLDLIVLPLALITVCLIFCLLVMLSDRLDYALKKGKYAPPRKTVPFINGSAAVDYITQPGYNKYDHPLRGGAAWARIEGMRRAETKPRKTKTRKKKVGKNA